MQNFQEKVKMLLFVDDMILFPENLKLPPKIMEILKISIKL